MFRTYNTSFIDLISATSIGQKLQFAQDGLVVAREVENQVIVMQDDEPEYVINTGRLIYSFSFLPYSGSSLADGGKIIFIPKNLFGQKFIIGEDSLKFAQTVVDLYGLTDTVIGSNDVTSSSNRGTNQVALSFVNMAEIKDNNLSIGSSSNTSQYVSFKNSGSPLVGSTTVLYDGGDIPTAVGTLKTVIITALFDAGEVTGLTFNVI
jgi:hypothetical protein